MKPSAGVARDDVHELGIAARIADIVKHVMEENGAARVGVVTIEVGTLAGVDRSSLEFCFDALTKGTPLDGANLNIEETRPRAHCRKCGADYEVKIDDFRCKACGSEDFDITAGTDISIRAVEVD